MPFFPRNNLGIVYIILMFPEIYKNHLGEDIILFSVATLITFCLLILFFDFFKKKFC